MVGEAHFLVATGAGVAAALAAVLSAAFFSLRYLERTFSYDWAASLLAFHLCCLVLFKTAFLLNLVAVTSLWTFGDLYLVFSPTLISLLTTYLVGSSFFLRAKACLRLLTLFGPSLLGLGASVSPATSPSPLTRTLSAITARSGPQMQPLADFLFLSPDLLGL